MRLTRQALTRAYVAAVIGAGAAVLAIVITGHLPAARGADAGLVALSVAVLLGEVFPLRLGPDEGEVAPSTTFMFALLLGYGAGVALLAQAAASMIADALHAKQPVRRAFNIAQYSLSIGGAGALYALVAPHGSSSGFGIVELAAAAAAGALYFLINTGTVAAVVALSSGTRLRDEISGDLMRQSATEIVLIGLAPLGVVALENNLLLLVLLVLPLVAVQRAGRHARLSAHLAAHDALTGLPNRVLFHERTRHAIATAKAGRHVAVMLIDLDRFKEINDTLGHHYGDEVLRQMAGRLTAGLPRSSAMIARLGGDEFSVLLPDVDSIDSAMALGDVLREALAAPFDAAGVRLELGASVGVATFPEDGHDVDTLMQRADVAMYQAKAASTGVERYAAEDDAHSIARLALASDLRRGLADGEFTAYFQPKIDLQLGRVSGAEALLRWRRGNDLVPPGTFIDLAEQTGFILPLTMHVLEHAVRACGTWRADGHDLTVAVNLSGRVLMDSALPDRVVELCRRNGVPLEALILEITESMIVADPARALPTVERLAELGAILAVDDFGTGYSSLEYLKRLPISQIKIDRGFVMAMHDDPRDEAIVQSTVQLGQSLGLRVVAEGVETMAAVESITRMGCDEAQGYILSRPLPPADFIRWVEHRNAPAHAPRMIRATI